MIPTEFKPQSTDQARQGLDSARQAFALNRIQAKPVAGKLYKQWFTSGIMKLMADASNDIYNTYKDCAECGECCTLTVIAMTHDEVRRIQSYMKENGIVAKDQGPEVCPLRGEDMRCMVYPARARTCRLHHCGIPRKALEAGHPEFAAPEDLPMVDMRQAFIHDDLRDPRTIPLDRLIAHYSM